MSYIVLTINKGPFEMLHCLNLYKRQNSRARPNLSFILLMLHWNLLYTVEPPNKGHAGTGHFVLCREVVLSLEVENVLVLL